MSSGSYGSYKGASERTEGYRSLDLGVRERAERERGVRLRSAADAASAEVALTRAKPMRRSVDPVERHLARNTITVPPKEAKEVHIVLTDNSGSNRAIAEALKNAAGYIHANFGIIAGNAAIAFQFFSDHCDGEQIFQEADYTMAGEEGSRVLRASIDQIDGAGGGDAPEAIECALVRACDYDFGHVPVEKRRLYLVSDEVAHGMGPRDGDDGCPNQQDWRKSLERVATSFGSFQVVASGDSPTVFDLQKKFIAPDRRAYDLMNLATGDITAQERCRLVPNALLVLVARNRGAQEVEAFLMLLLEKWLENPMYGSNTVRRARAQITDFSRYLEISNDERKKLLDRIFAGLSET